MRVCYKHVDTFRPPRPMTTSWTGVRAAQRAPRNGRAHRAGPTYAPNEYFLSEENKIYNIFELNAVNKNLCFPEKKFVFSYYTLCGLSLLLLYTGYT